MRYSRHNADFGGIILDFNLGKLVQRNNRHTDDFGLDLATKLLSEDSTWSEKTRQYFTIANL